MIRDPRRASTWERIRRPSQCVSSPRSQAVVTPVISHRDSNSRAFNGLEFIGLGGYYLRKFTHMLLCEKVIRRFQVERTSSLAKRGV